MSELKAAETLKINELRVGNWVNYDDGPTPAKVKSINSIRIEVGLEHFPKPLSVAVLSPIPLNEDILLKCGFTHHARSVDLGMSGYYPKEFWYILEGMDEFNQRIFKNDFHLGQFRDGFYYQINYRKKGIKIESLHQLANLYFSLTGIELEINL